MATWKIRPISPVYRRDRDVFKNFLRAAAQTFQKGAPLVQSTDGRYVEECGADPALIIGFALADADGYDWQDDTFGTVDPTVPFAVADQEFRGTLEGTLDIDADVGTAFGLVKDATGYWTIDRSDTTATRVTITGLEDGVADGDVNPPVRFVVLPANQQEVL